jgi:hypothetical protein
MEFMELSLFIKMCQNTPQLCWGDEWPTLSPPPGQRPFRAGGKGEESFLEN